MNRTLGFTITLAKANGKPWTNYLRGVWHGVLLSLLVDVARLALHWVGVG